MPKDHEKKSPKGKESNRNKVGKSAKDTKRRHESRARDGARRRKKDESSDSSDSSYTESDEEFNGAEYKKFLSRLFPSRYINERVKELNRDSEDEESDDESSDGSDWEPAKRPVEARAGGLVGLPTRGRYRKLGEDEDEEDEEDEEDDDDDDEERGAQNPQFNIILTLGDPKHQEDESEEDTEESDESEEDTEESGGKATPKKASRRDKELDDELEGLLGGGLGGGAEAGRAKNQRVGRRQRHREETSEPGCDRQSVSSTDTDDELTDRQVVVNFMRMARRMQEKHDNGVIEELIGVGKKKYKEIRKREDAKDRKAKFRNLQKFRKILSERNVMNDYAFFRKMPPEKQQKLIDELEEVNKHARIETPYRIGLLESDIPVKFKGAAMKKINALKYMEPGNGEYYKSKTWVDTFMHLPFGKYHELPINRSHGVDACHDFMDNAKKTLDTAVYGLNDAKLQIMQMVGQWISNPQAVGTSIAIKGPMGTGKTTLVKEGISKILNREFAFIALGGATDSSFLEGHSYTYEGSTWGKIVDILIQSKSMNPIIYFDELDKVSDTPKGEEIAGILTHLTDSSQNSQFHDKYFAEIDFDLSKCLFIFSYNDESRINPILKDRMYRIQTKGYSKKEKDEIASNYLLPTIRATVDFAEGDVEIETAALHHIIDTYTDDEQGVRNLKRALEIIHTKLNLYRLMRPGTNLFEEDMSLDVTFPFTVTISVVDKLLKAADGTSSHMSMYM